MAQRELWSAAKLAVRAYAHDPSQKNTVKVALAWKAIREFNATATKDRLLDPRMMAGKNAASAHQAKESRGA